MILIIGGAHSGKRAYVQNVLGYAPEDMSDTLNEAPVLYHLQELLKTDAELDRLLPQLLNKAVVICDEVGCGVTPMDKTAREWRETVGRACCVLAQKARCVIRVQCGIGIKIKGE